MNLVFGTMADLREQLTQTQARAEYDLRREGFKPKPRARELRAVDAQGELVTVEEWKNTQREIVELQKDERVERVFVEGVFEDQDGDFIDGGEWSVMVSYGNRRHLIPGDTIQVRSEGGTFEDGWTFEREITDGNITATNPDGETNIGVRAKNARLQRVIDPASRRIAIRDA